MNRIIPHITMANKNLSDKKDMIFRVVKIAEEFVFPRLKIDWDIDVIFTNRVYEFVIPEDGVGGRAYASDFVLIAVDDGKITEDLLLEMFVHELCHAARWGKNSEWANTLIDNILNEGIATYFEFEFVKNKENKQFFLKTIIDRTDEENQKILEALKEQLNNPRYDYRTIFFDGNNKLPRWSGYSLGYYLVKKYLEKTNKRIEEAFSDKYKTFKETLLP